MIVSGTIPTVDNAWHHVAVSRTGSSVYLWIDGVQSGSTGSSSQNFNAGATNGMIVGSYGGDPTGGGHFSGYIADVRIVNGTGLYSSSFTPPTAPLSAVSNTSVLLKMQNAGIVDSAMMIDLFTGGSAQISTSVKKYGTGSLSFNGSTDYLKIPPTVNLSLGTGNFTFECWVYFNSVASGSIISNSNTGGNILNGLNIYLSSSGTLLVYGPSVSGTTTTTVATGQWYHIAVTRTTNTFTLWKDGVSQGTFTDSGSISGTDTTRPFTIGEFGLYNSGYLNGYIDDLRITSGYARYTSNFTPSTTAFVGQ